MISRFRGFSHAVVKRLDTGDLIGEHAMMRTAGAFILLASLSGCLQTDRGPNASPFGQSRKSQKASAYQGPYGEPIAPGNTPRQGMSPGLLPAGYFAGNSPKAGTDLIQAGFMQADGKDVNGHSRIQQANHFDTGPAVNPKYRPNGGIAPVPGMGPAGAVAAFGALPFNAPRQPMNMRTSVNFASPDGMRVTWYGPNGWSDTPLVTPARYNFLQGGVYRMKMSSVPNRLEKVYYPTLEIVPAHETSMTYLAHSAVPVTFTDADFEQVDSGNMLVKVVYLPNIHNQDYASVVGPNELVSTRLEPNVDPIVEAQRLGTILLIVRMGNIDLNAPNTPAMDAPNPYMMQNRPFVGGPPPMNSGNGPNGAAPILPGNNNPAKMPEKNDIKIIVPPSLPNTGDGKPLLPPALPGSNNAGPLTLPEEPKITIPPSVNGNEDLKLKEPPTFPMSNNITPKVLPTPETLKEDEKPTKPTRLPNLP
ncbi:MAG: hypothetical protein K8T89_22780 [Planctomycetes bacterium]|nr:hypothetical protein [Planctomycetota bacterium]